MTFASMMPESTASGLVAGEIVVVASAVGAARLKSAATSGSATTVRVVACN